MRGIKFRAWCPKRHRFAPHIEVYEDGSFNVGEVEDALSGLILWDDELHKILMQYTGLHDKNGREVFEGDVVKTMNGELGSVEFQDGAYVLRRKAFPDELAFFVADDCVVIGNIYENAELLKAKHGK